MDVLIGLVIATFIIAAAYVGYHASQDVPEAKGHSIPPYPDVLGEDAPALQHQMLIARSVS